jgi:hypothetical protein
METYLQKDYVIIKYYKDKRILILEWLKISTSSEFREGMNALISAMEHFKTGKLICCLTNAGALHPDDQQWVASDWHNRALAVGHSHVAIILAKDIFVQISIEGSMGNVTLPTAYFDNLEDAIDWIA